MKLTLDDGEEIEILSINFEGGLFDWRRTKGYTGACVSKLSTANITTFESSTKNQLKISLEKELKKAELGKEE